MHFGRRVQTHREDNLRVVTNATALHINTNRNASVVTGIEVASLEGDRREIHAPSIVLCAGGIENARQLLASNRCAAAGLGISMGSSGDFSWTIHVDSVATFDVRDYARLRRHFGIHDVRTASGNHLFAQGLRLNPTAQRREGLLNCAVWLTEMITPDDPWSAVKRLLRGKAVLRTDAASIIRNVGLLAYGAHRHLIRRRGLQNVAHPIGTTRMASDPTREMVDATGQMHGVNGLYVAGSSVFPTAGHANPTQMIVAMAVRLADELKRKDLRDLRQGSYLPTKELSRREWCRGVRREGPLSCLTHPSATFADRRPGSWPREYR